MRLPAHVRQLSQLLPVSTCQAPVPTAATPAVPSANGTAWNGILAAVQGWRKECLEATATNTPATRLPRTLFQACVVLKRQRTKSATMKKTLQPLPRRLSAEGPPAPAPAPADSAGGAAVKHGKPSGSPSQRTKERIEPRRIALKYASQTIVLEYKEQATGKLRHRSFRIDVDRFETAQQCERKLWGRLSKAVVPGALQAAQVGKLVAQLFQHEKQQNPDADELEMAAERFMSAQVEKPTPTRSGLKPMPLAASQVLARAHGTHSGTHARTRRGKHMRTHTCPTVACDSLQCRSQAGRPGSSAGLLRPTELRTRARHGWLLTSVDPAAGEAQPAARGKIGEERRQHRGQQRRRRRGRQGKQPEPRARGLARWGRGQTECKSQRGIKRRP